MTVTHSAHIGGGETNTYKALQPEELKDYEENLSWPTKK